MCSVQGSKKELGEQYSKHVHSWLLSDWLVWLMLNGQKLDRFKTDEDDRKRGKNYTFSPTHGLLKARGLSSGLWAGFPAINEGWHKLCLWIRVGTFYVNIQSKLWGMSYCGDDRASTVCVPVYVYVCVCVWCVASSEWSLLDTPEHSFSTLFRLMSVFIDMSVFACCFMRVW